MRCESRRNKYYIANCNIILLHSSSQSQNKTYKKEKVILLLIQQGKVCSLPYQQARSHDHYHHHIKWYCCCCCMSTITSLPFRLDSTCLVWIYFLLVGVPLLWWTVTHSSQLSKKGVYCTSVTKGQRMLVIIVMIMIAIVILAIYST